MARQGRKPVGQPRLYQEGALSPNRIAWLQTYIGQFVLMMYPEGAHDDTDTESIKAEPGPTIRLLLPKNGRTQYYSITALTLDEFNHFEEFLMLMLELARPIIEQRDKAAQDAYDQGNDSIARLYRQVSRLVVRSGQIDQHRISVRNGSEGVPAGDRPAGDPDGGVRGDGDELADGEPQDGGPQDDEPPTD